MNSEIAESSFLQKMLAGPQRTTITVVQRLSRPRTTTSTSCTILSCPRRQVHLSLSLYLSAPPLDKISALVLLPSSRIITKTQTEKWILNSQVKLMFFLMCSQFFGHF